jgi:ferredoxin
METAFISKLKPPLDALAKRMEVYLPHPVGKHFVFNRYDPSAEATVELNSIRTCTPVKEFLFPVREIAATFPGPVGPEETRPFAVFGLKECDLRSIAILDKVFAEDEFKDPLYLARRQKMFIISSDCTELGETCFCGLFEGKGYSEKGFDLNASKIKDGFIIEVGSRKGREFVEQNAALFADVPNSLLSERDRNRSNLKQLLQKRNSDFDMSETLKEIVEKAADSELFDEEAKNCIECQACTRVCPTCHCFYLYDAKQKDYFAKMKIWDSCIRFSYAAVAGGANPNKVLGDRMRHRLMHKFVYFLERYGVNMCVGCGRCVDADAGGIDLRQILKQLSEESQGKGKEKTQVAK